jgi:hypothetical protein
VASGTPRGVCPVCERAAVAAMEPAVSGMLPKVGGPESDSELPQWCPLALSGCKIGRTQSSASSSKRRNGAYL